MLARRAARCGRAIASAHPSLPGSAPEHCRRERTARLSVHRPARNHQSPTHGEVRCKRIWVGYLFRDGRYFCPGIEHMGDAVVAECAKVVGTEHKLAPD